MTTLHYLPGFFSFAEINAALELSAPLILQSGDIIGRGDDPDLPARRSEIKWMAPTEENDWLYQKLTAALQKLNEDTWSFDLEGINEALQYTEYRGHKNGEGFYAWHLDLANEGLASTRKLSFECMLTDDYGGGELSVLLGPEEYKVQLKKGDAVVFPSFLASKVYPVERGVRKSLVGWAAGPRFR